MIAAEAVEIARAHEERGNEALACAILARASGGQEAAGLYGVALGLARECGMAPLVGRCEAALLAEAGLMEVGED